MGINLESYTRDELKEMAKENGFSNYHNWSKSKLIKEIYFATQGGEKELDEIVKILSSQANKWKEYLKKIGVSAEDYLKIHPNHKFKVFIEELISK